MIRGLLLASIGISVGVLAFAGFRVVRARYLGFRRSFIGRTRRDLDYLHSDLQPDQVLVLTILGMVLFGGAALVADFSAWVTIAALAVGYALPRTVIAALRERRKRRFEAQLVEAIGMVASSLRIGLNLHAAIRTVVNDMERPISQEFGLVLRETQLGATLEQAMEHLARRMEVEDLDLVVTAIAVAHQTGGDLGEIFENIAAKIRERNRIRGKIRAATTAGRLQGLIVALIPPALLFWTFLRDPERVAAFYAGPQGMAILGVVLALYGAAFLSIRRILKVEM